MGLFNSLTEKASKKLDKFQNPPEHIDKNKFKVQKEYNEELPKNQQNSNQNKKNNNDYFDEFEDNFSNNDSRFNDEPVNLLPAQKPESFHFFILENQYQDLERAIRGVKDVWDKDNQKWVIKRKDVHCFTDEEAEDIVRTAQTHLSSDIKLAIFSREEYPILLTEIFEQMWDLFKEIIEYRFGRFGNITNQLKMKNQAVNIFNMLMMRIKANYSRAREGRENIATHDSVKGQESLNQTDRKEQSRSYT